MTFEEELVALQQFKLDVDLYGFREARKRLMEKMPTLVDWEAEERRQVQEGMGDDRNPS